jgi:hypothetical protein
MKWDAKKKKYIRADQVKKSVFLYLISWSVSKLS